MARQTITFSAEHERKLVDLHQLRRAKRKESSDKAMAAVLYPASTQTLGPAAGQSRTLSPMRVHGT